MHDSGQQYVDPVVTHQVCFNIRVPNGVAPVPYMDEPIGTAGPPDNSIGACSYFFFQTLPNTVNFGSVCFQETFSEQVFTWPNGTQYVRPAGSLGFTVDYAGDLTPNWAGDMVITGGPWVTERLLVPNSNPPTYQDCQFNVVQQLQFLTDDNSGWVTYASPTHPRKFSGNTFETQVGWGGVWGGLQGPYQETGQ